MASGVWILLVFSFFYLVGIYPVEAVNRPPVRAELGTIRRNADPLKSVLIHLAESRSSWI
jgi:hypothetical protein